MTAQNWGFTGPEAVTHFLKESGEIKFAQPESAFYPISFRHRNHMIRKRFDVAGQLGSDTYGVHFWARRMKPRLEEKEGGSPDAGSFMADAVMRHGIVCDDAPIPRKIVKQDPRAKDAEFLADLALEGLRADASPEAIARKHNVEPKLVREAIATLQSGAASLFKR
ncbi:hypothetical protein [Falsihalocynthiibacter arcticus]|uniref:Uncharacterized protein n=1 Tax=Falsihalocynthiibacter arcticus TaxID=1579316 RepID=A0A126UYQ8_9RHOB|nr:hypothetical protein [Falsihalocynthiibacter arcticus]AML51193.1 hypothetical protein RC74_07925 [Falsihalocynthiibacter arcticus]